MGYTYEQQNKAIFKDAVIFSIVSFCIEFIFFLFYLAADLFTYGMKWYIIKNLISPSLINFLSIGICYFIYKKNISQKINDWAASLAIAIPACVISLFHSSYPEITLCMIYSFGFSNSF